MVAVTTVLSIAGAVKGAVGQIQQGRAAQQEANFRAQTARQQAERDLQIGQLEQENLDRDFARRMASIRAKNPGVTQAGSPTFLIDELTDEFLFNKALTENNTQTTVASGRQGADLLELGGKNARRASLFNAGGELFGAVNFGKDGKGGGGPKKVPTRTGAGPPRNPSNPRIG